MLSDAFGSGKRQSLTVVLQLRCGIHSAEDGTEAREGSLREDGSWASRRLDESYCAGWAASQ